MADSDTNSSEPSQRLNRSPAPVEGICDSQTDVNETGNAHVNSRDVPFGSYARHASNNAVWKPSEEAARFKDTFIPGRCCLLKNVKDVRTVLSPEHLSSMQPENSDPDPISGRITQAKTDNVFHDIPEYSVNDSVTIVVPQQSANIEPRHYTLGTSTMYQLREAQWDDVSSKSTAACDEDGDSDAGDTSIEALDQKSWLLTVEKASVDTECTHFHNKLDDNGTLAEPEPAV